MFEKLMRMYVMGLAYDVRSPMPHLVGPPGCGKSSVVEDLAGIAGVNLHVINVSRLSPLEVEGVQMPHGSGEDMILKMLTATFWTQLKEGDILLLDEFLRGFPEVYNSLLDIFTSRRVGAYRLPKVFIIGASNSTATYDPALEDRLLHIPVPDARTSKSERARIGQLLVDHLGLLPEMANSQEMEELINHSILPGYDILDSFKKKGRKVVATSPDFVSVRNLIGQAQLKQISTSNLKSMIEMNNIHAMNKGKAQFVVLTSARTVPSGYRPIAEKLQGNAKLTELQALNISMNLQLLEMQDAATEKED